MSSLIPKIAWPLFVISIGALLVVICFGGTRVYYDGNYFGWFETWEHGWPGVFLTRGGYSTSARYSFWVDVDEFRPWTLLLDTSVFAAILGVLIIVPYWFRRRSRAQHRGAVFSLFSLFVAVTICCLLLGNIGYSLAQSRNERSAMAKLRKQGHQVEIKYIGPIWLARLQGGINPHQESMLHGCRSVHPHFTKDDSLQDLLAQMRPLRHLERIDFSGCLISDEDLRTLTIQHCTGLKSLAFKGTFVTGSSFVEPRHWPRLKVVVASDSSLDDAGFDKLAKIPCLQWIEVSNTKITRQSIATAEKMPNLKTFVAKGIGFTAADCAVLKERGVEFYLED
ncbi:hypothetical protein [Anatilimnocola floriformis]|uniref:hypothetical protein n=1 Tax=Anatilimnocola floriformis TaxID=2948575 RepID=UPI0020C4D629|nr:hypothetical protein [Anatilimnocola floriformis]